MALNFTKLQTKAETLLTDNGQTVSWSRTTGATFDPVLGQYTGGTTTVYSTIGPLLDYKTERVDGVNVLRTDKRVIVPNGDVPELNEQVTIGGTAYTVIAISEKSPNGTVLAYEIQLRK